MRAPDELRELTEEYLADLALTPELSRPRDGASVRPGRWREADPARARARDRRGRRRGVEDALPAAAALELVHTFSLVHDDLPCMDDDEERRGRPSTWAQFGEAAGIARGRCTARGGVPARACVSDTRGRAGARAGDARDDRRTVSRHRRARCRSRRAAQAEDGASVRRCDRSRALGCRACRRAEQAPWRAFSEELGLLFQVVDDVLDGDGYVLRARRADGARALAAESASRARDRLGAIAADTSVLGEIVDGLAVRTA